MCYTSIGHVEQDIGKLDSLADGPVEKSNVVSKGHLGRVQDNVLQSNIEVDGRVIAGVIAQVEEGVGEVGRGLKHRSVGGITHNNGVNVRLKGLAQTVRASWDVDNSRSTSRAPSTGAATGCAIGIVKGSLDGSPVVSDTVSLGAKVRLDVTEDLPVLAIGDERADAVVLDFLVPVARGVSGLDAVSWYGTTSCNGSQAEEELRESHLSRGSTGPNASIGLLEEPVPPL